MRKIVLALLCAFALNAQAAPTFSEGEEYDRILPPAPTSVPPDKVEVAEVFWYGCPHCYDFEPYLEKWEQSKPEAVELVRLPATLNPSWLGHARAYYALEIMGEVPRVHKAFFQAIHEQGRLLTDLDSITRFLAQQGVDEAAFRKAYNSREAKTRLQRADELQRSYMITGVPSVIVDGQYLTSASQAGSYENMLAVIDHLVAMEAGAGGE
ncbi:MAG: thiol:disulfide interchange protein DsbA/DsbL [Gammaproteobacteria bacterium]|nr:thiol:disulfide interchange protein DsbA/DsbL [Gammaproteobacteria bacterium]